MNNTLPKILVVDDLAANQIATKKLLAQVRAEIILAGSGMEALELCLRHDFAMVLLDVNMPEMDGYEVAAGLRDLEQTKNTPILYLTATYHDELYQLKGYDAGAVDYISKPINERILLSKVTIFLELFNQKQALEQEITERKRIEKQLVEAMRLAEAATEAKSRFLANISHEIRTPMNGVLGMAQLLSKTSLTPEQSDYLNTLMSSGNNLLTLINDILDFSRIEVDKIILEQIPFNLETLLRETINLMSSLAQGKKLDLIFSISPNLPINLIGDPHRLRQVLFNLIGNAIKFTEQGHVELSITLKQEDQFHPQFRFAVIDTGIGFPVMEKERLFQAFEQADDSSIRLGGGTGLGLAISDRLVQLMGGSIEVANAPSHGSVFSFSLAFPKDTLLTQPIVTEKKQPLNTSKSIPIIMDIDRVEQLIVELTKRLVDHNPDIETLVRDLDQQLLASPAALVFQNTKSHIECYDYKSALRTMDNVQKLLKMPVDPLPSSKL